MSDQLAERTVTLLETKPLEGDEELRLLRVDPSPDDEPTEERLLIALSARGLHTYSIFAGMFRHELSPAECRDYFARIGSSDDFFRLSERIDAMFKEVYRGR